MCEAGIVFLKTSLSLSCAPCSFPRQTGPRCRFYSTVTTLVFLSYAVFNKSLKPNVSIGPSLVLCLIHCHSPTPSAFYFALQSWSSAWRSFRSRQLSNVDRYKPPFRRCTDVTSNFVWLFVRDIWDKVVRSLGSSRVFRGIIFRPFQVFSENFDFWKLIPEKSGEVTFSTTDVSVLICCLFPSE